MMSRLLRLFFKRRGYTQSFLDGMDDPSHGVMLGVPELCTELKHIHDTGQHLVLIPDFDMDGICVGVTGFAGLSELGFRVSLYIPDPKDGYGFGADVIDEVLRLYPDANAILTGDVGITCHEGVQRAKLAGLKVLITDHHKQGQTLPDADVVVDPMRTDDPYEHPFICGAHVLYQCLCHYASTYGTAYELEQIQRLAVFAGIGTVSDRMTLYYENRPLVQDAIAICRLLFCDNSDFIIQHISGTDPYRKAFYGLFSVLQYFGTMGKLEQSGDIDEDFFGYYLAPAFNSVKRIGDDMSVAFGVFFGNNPEEDVKKLYELNEERKRLEKEFLQDLLDHDQSYSPFIYFTDAPGGIRGLLAQRMMAVTGLPCLCIGRGDLSGSGRSPAWFPFLDEVLPLGFHVAGHNPAFGVSFGDLADVMSMRQYLIQRVPVVLSDCRKAGIATGLVYDLTISTLGDGDVGIDILAFSEFLECLSNYAPFGAGFEQPNVLLVFRANEGQWRKLGSEQQHLKVSLDQGFEVLLWNQAEEISRAGSDVICFVAGKLSRSEYMGTHRINFTGSFVEDPG